MTQGSRNRAQAKRATGGAFRPPMSVIRRSGSKMDDGSPTLQGGVAGRSKARPAVLILDVDGQSGGSRSGPPEAVWWCWPACARHVQKAATLPCGVLHGAAASLPRGVATTRSESEDVGERLPSSGRHPQELQPHASVVSFGPITRR